MVWDYTQYGVLCIDKLPAFLCFEKVVWEYVKICIASVYMGIFCFGNIHGAFDSYVYDADILYRFIYCGTIQAIHG